MVDAHRYQHMSQHDSRVKTAAGNDGSDLTQEQTDWLFDNLSHLAARRIAQRKTDWWRRSGGSLLTGLSPDDRLAVTMIDGEGASVKEVADRTGWSESK